MSRRLRFAVRHGITVILGSLAFLLTSLAISHLNQDEHFVRPFNCAGTGTTVRCDVRIQQAGRQAEWVTIHGVEVAAKERGHRILVSVDPAAPTQRFDTHRSCPYFFFAGMSVFALWSHLASCFGWARTASRWAFGRLRSRTREAELHKSVWALVAGIGCVWWVFWGASGVAVVQAVLTGLLAGVTAVYAAHVVRQGLGDSDAGVSLLRDIREYRFVRQQKHGRRRFSRDKVLEARLAAAHATECLLTWPWVDPEALQEVRTLHRKMRRSGESDLDLMAVEKQLAVELGQRHK